MKKLIYCALALAAGLFASSCQQEELAPVGEAGVVTFEVAIPELATKSYDAEGKNVNDLVYAVYSTAAETIEEAQKCNDLRFFYAVNETSGASFDANGKGIVSLELLNDQNYLILFWAQSNDAWVKAQGSNINLFNVTYPTSMAANNEHLEAFSGVAFIKNVKGARKETVKLTRPFAQINIATTMPEAFTATLSQSEMSVVRAAKSFNVATQHASEDAQTVSFTAANVPVADFKTGYTYAGANYIFANGNVDVTYKIYTSHGNVENTVHAVPVAKNYRTNIIGNLLTSDVEYTVELDKNWKGEYERPADGDSYTTNEYVATADEFNAAFTAAFEGDKDNNVITLSGDINLNELLATRNVTPDPSYTLAAGKTLTIDLNGKTLSATSAQSGKNYNMFDVRGNLTVKNGTIMYKHEGENMGWGSSTNIFHVEGGVLNLDGVTAMNLGGSDMGFIVHLNNWSDNALTLNVENSTLESNYVAVRVFNSGPRMNNVTIKNSTLKGGSSAFWVHNYTVEDFGTEAKAEAQKALLNLNIYNQGNTFSPDVNGIRYGFTNSVKTDAYGITKVVSEDGTEVTLGSLVENGVIRRGVAGAEENTTIKKAVVEEGVAVLYDRTFRRFYALEEVVLPSTLTTIGAEGTGVFQSCNNLKTIVLPESLTVLGKGSFQECTSLESINIPAGVTRIESDALRNTGLKSVEFHAGVTYFGAQAFRDCKQLTEVVINAPEFTMENNTFGIMAAPFTPMTIHVANAEMKAYVESKLTAHAKTYITVVAPEVVENTADLQAALAEGKKVVLANDLTITADEGITAPYGNKTALSQNGGVFDGNGKTITSNIAGDSYIYMTNGGTTKNVNITGAFRGVMIMSPTQTVYLENVVSGGKGVVYAFNTGEGDSTQDVVATNCTFNGWCSWSEIKSATFNNCTFGQGSEYSNVTGRIGRPYVNTVFDGCNFCSKYYIDLSVLKADQKVTVKNCTVNGVKITAENWTSLVAPEDTCGEGQISVELKNGTFLTAENLADYIVFE